MPSLLVRALKYCLLPGRPSPTQRASLHDESFRFWRDFWTGVLRANETPDKLDEGEFRRIDRIAVLLHGERPIGLIGHTFFDLKYLSEREHSYFKHRYNEAFMRELEKRGATRIMTEEYLAVAPDWRKSRLDVSLASVLIGLGLKLAQAEQVQAVVTVPREDISMDKRTMEQGAVRVQSGLDIYNTPCSLVAFFPETICPAPDEKVNELIAYFWKNRIDTTKTRADEADKVLDEELEKQAA
jgi:hypothetical protein